MKILCGIDPCFQRAVDRCETVSRLFGSLVSEQVPGTQSKGARVIPLQVRGLIELDERSVFNRQYGWYRG